MELAQHTPPRLRFASKAWPHYNHSHSKMRYKSTVPRELVGLAAVLISGGLMISGCSSMGHEKRAVPKIAKPIGEVSEFGFDPDNNQLAVAIEKLLDSRGRKVKLVSSPKVRQQRGEKEYTYDEVQTRYVLKVRSLDLDTCLR